MQTTGSFDAPANDAPRPHDSTIFASDVVLVGSFVISVGIPLYYVYGYTGHPALTVWYLSSAIGLPVVLPVGLWMLRWGQPTRRTVCIMTRGSLLYSLPMLLCVVAIVWAGFDIALTGVSIMIYIAAIIMVVANAWLTGTHSRRRVRIVRWISAVLTPVIVLGLTDALPHGLEAIQGWGIPIPVMAAGAYGCMRSFRHVSATDQAGVGV